MDGLTLAELKAAAAEAGFDPHLIERAARLLPVRSLASPSLVERLMGGEVRSMYEANFPKTLEESGAAELLSAVRIAVGQPGGVIEEHPGTTRMTWYTSSDSETLSISARPEQGYIAITVALDRSRALVGTGVVTLTGSFLAGLFGVFAIGPEFTPALGAAASLSGIGAVVALARGYWTSSTRRARERIERAMDSASRSLSASSATRGVGENAAPAAFDGQDVS